MTSKERRLFPEEILLGSADEAHRSVAQEVGVRHLAQCTFERVDLRGERRFHRDERFACVDHGCRDREPLEHLVRVRSHERSILERPRLAFRAVHHRVAIAELSTARRDRAPLDGGGKARATSTA
jgi:hypothetical protein